MSRLILPKRLKNVATDTEGTGLFPYLGDRAFALSAFDEDSVRQFYRWEVNPHTREVSGWHRYDEAVAWLWDERVRKIFHNAPYDVRMLDFLDWPVLGPIDDTIILWSVLFSNLQKAGLKFLAKKYAGINDDDEEELHAATIKARRKAKKMGWAIAEEGGRFGKTPVNADYWLAPFPVLKKYACLDAERTLYLFKLGEELLDEDPRLRKTYEREMRRLYPVTYGMIGKGIRCDPAVCRFERAKNLMKQRFHYKRVLKAIRPLGLETINLGSNPQKIALIYGKLKIPIKHYTDKGNPSVDAEALKSIDHPLVKDIMSYDAAEKANSTFFDKYLLHTVDEGGVPVLHPEFWQIGARTGRFSCRNPNLQNVANALNTRGAEPIQARTPFGPRPDYIWYHFDWSQIEMWIFAAESRDEGLLADLRTGNIHTATANRVFGRGDDIVAEEMKSGRSNARARAKMLNFGVVFGMGIPAVMDFLKCSRAEAKAQLELYYEGYKRIRPYMREIADLAERQGFVYNQYGRKLTVDRGFGYKAVNYIVQSNACDHMKNKMIWMAEECARLRQAGVDAHLVLTVHDELVVEAPARWDANKWIRSTKEVLEDHDGMWDLLDKLPCEVKMTRQRWDVNEKVEA